METGKEEYLWKLRVNLHGIPDEEREEAMKYYTNYFDEAGLENEKKVMEELGSPEELAKTIISDLEADKNNDTIKDTLATPEKESSGTKTYGYYTEELLKKKREEDAKRQQERAREQRDDDGKKSSAKLWLLIILILTSPIWGGILLGVLGLVAGALIAVLLVVIALVFACGVIVIGLIVGGILCIIRMAVTAALTPVAAGFVISLALVMICFGILLIKIFLALFRFLIPRIIRRIVRAVINSGYAIAGFIKGIEENR